MYTTSYKYTCMPMVTTIGYCIFIYSHLCWHEISRLWVMTTQYQAPHQSTRLHTSHTYTHTCKEEWGNTAAKYMYFNWHSMKDNIPHRMFWLMNLLQLWYIWEKAHKPNMLYVWYYVLRAMSITQIIVHQMTVTSTSTGTKKKIAEGWQCQSTQTRDDNKYKASLMLEATKLCYIVV